MKTVKVDNKICSNQVNKPVATVIEIDQISLHLLTERICQSEQCRYPLLALRLLIYVITSIDGSGKVYISARHLSRKLDVNYDTVTKCLKYLREIDVLRIEK